MFSEVPQYLSTVSPFELEEVVRNPPSDVHSLRMLLELRQLQEILSHLSYMELVHLTKHLSSGLTPTEQLDLLCDLQTIMQSWSLSTIRQYHEMLKQTPLHLERSTLLKLEPAFPIKIAHLTIQLLKLPFVELEAFKLWVEGLPRSQMILLVNLLQMEGNDLFEIKQRIVPEMEKKKQPQPGQKRKREESETMQEKFGLLRMSSESVAKAPRMDVCLISFAGSFSLFAGVVGEYGYGRSLRSQ